MAGYKGMVTKRGHVTSATRRPARWIRITKVGSHAQAPRTEAQRKSRAKTDRRNARFAYTEANLRPLGYVGPNVSKSRHAKVARTVLGEAVARGRMVGRQPSVQNIPRVEFQAGRF